MFDKCTNNTAKYFNILLFIRYSTVHRYSIDNEVQHKIKNCEKKNNKTECTNKTDTSSSFRSFIITVSYSFYFKNSYTLKVCI